MVPSDAQKEFRSGKHVQRVQFNFIHFHFAWLRAPETTLENKVHKIFFKSERMAIYSDSTAELPVMSCGGLKCLVPR